MPFWFGRAMKFPSSINAGLLLLSAALILGVAVSFRVGHELDRGLLMEIVLREGRSPDWMVAIARWLSWIGNSEQVILLLLPITAWLIWDRRFAAALLIIVMPPFSTATNAALKEGFARQRPAVVPHIDRVYDLSFPSGHAAGAAVTCILIALLFPGTNPRTRIAVGIAMAALIGFSRIQLGVHYPSDVLAGWLWGAGMALIGFGVTAAARTRQ
jgi:undecaprenyl-diphosphatase